MENASKALLIAGAILICIVLISVGMLVLNSTTDVTDQVGDITASQAAQAFNNQYMNYAGMQKGSSVKRLIDTIATNNSVSTSRQINIIFVGEEGVLQEMQPNEILKEMSKIVNSAKYEIRVIGMDNEGYVNSIMINETGEEVLICPACGAIYVEGGYCNCPPC